MDEYRFDVFGMRVAIRATGTPSPRWAAFLLGAEGKRRPGGFVVPDFVEPGELRQYLADLFHESAKRSNDQVRPID
jgi:hypothetical protein